MWWVAAGMAISAASQYLGAQGAKANIKNQKAWADYNAQVQYGVDVNNIKAQTQITQLNSSLLLAANTASNDANTALIEYNGTIIEQTALYNDLLYEEDLANMWSQAGLDIQLIGMQRQRERGEIEAQQSSSGTVMGVGSNADVIIDQMTQESLDKFIVKTGANIQAANINNARVQSLYKADQEIRKITFEGRVQNNTSTVNASLQSMAMLAQNEISSIAGMTDAEIRKTTGISNNSARAAQQTTGANNDFVSGMMGIAANGMMSMSSKASSAPPGTTTPTTPGAVVSGGKTSILTGTSPGALYLHEEA